MRVSWPRRLGFGPRGRGSRGRVTAWPRRGPRGRVAEAAGRVWPWANPHCTCSAHLKPCGMGGHFWLQNLPLMWKRAHAPASAPVKYISARALGPSPKANKQAAIHPPAPNYPIWGGRAGLFSTQVCDNARHLNKRTLQLDRT